MKRLAAVFALTLVAFSLVVSVRPAAAGIHWCRKDPRISVGGRIANVYVSSYADIVATGPTRVVITVPTGYAATAQVLAQDDGFGFGYEVSFVESVRLRTTRNGAIAVQVRVYVPSSSTALPVKVELATADDRVVGDKEGRVNAWVTTRGAI